MVIRAPFFGLILLGTALLPGCTQLNLTAPEMLTGRIATAPAPELNRAPVPLGPLVSAENQPPTSPQTERARQVLAKLLTSNAQLQLKPELVVRDAANVAILHSGENRVILTKGLVDRCPGDDQLAAVLALEIGKIAVERRERTQALSPGTERGTPLYVPIGRDFGGSGAGDPLYRAEIALETQFARKDAIRDGLANETQGQDHKLLARQYLSRAGYPEAAVETVPGLLISPTLGDPKRLPPQILPPAESQPR